jgi:hypothetical protein
MSLQHGNSNGMAPYHFVWVVMSVGRWKRMSDIYVTYQYEDKLKHKVTNCAQLHPAPTPHICGLFSIARHEGRINYNFIGWNSSYEKLIEWPECRQNGNINMEFRKCIWRWSLIKWPKLCLTPGCFDDRDGRSCDVQDAVSWSSQ